MRRDKNNTTNRTGAMIDRWTVNGKYYIKEKGGYIAGGESKIVGRDAASHFGNVMRNHLDALEAAVSDIRRSHSQGIWNESGGGRAEREEEEW